MKRNTGIDLMRLLCAFLIVCIHYPFPGTLGYLFAPVTRLAVPVFFMITGYFYANVKEKNGQKQQISKIFKLFLGANLLYFVVSFVKSFFAEGSVGGFFQTCFSFKSLVKFLVFNESPFGGHLWYLGAILYVLVIVFLWEKKWRRKHLYPLIPVLLLGDLILGKYSVLFFMEDLPVILARNFLFTGLPFFLLGDLLRKYKQKLRVNLQAAFLLIFFFAGLTLVESHFLTSRQLSGSREHYISTIFLAISAFWFASQIRISSKNKPLTAISKLGKNLTTGIYILHPLVGLGVSACLVKIPARFGSQRFYSYLAPFLIYFGSMLLVWAWTRLTKKRKHNRKKEGAEVK